MTRNARRPGRARGSIRAGCGRRGPGWLGWTTNRGCASISTRGTTRLATILGTRGRQAVSCAHRELDRDSCCPARDDLDPCLGPDHTLALCSDRVLSGGEMYGIVTAGAGLSSQRLKALGDDDRRQTSPSWLDDVHEQRPRFSDFPRGQNTGSDEGDGKGSDEDQRCEEGTDQVRCRGAIVHRVPPLERAHPCRAPGKGD